MRVKWTQTILMLLVQSDFDKCFFFLVYFNKCFFTFNIYESFVKSDQSKFHKDHTIKR